MQFVKKCLFFVSATTLFLLIVHSANAEENWKDAFEDICSQVRISESLTIEELTSLIERVDKLLPEIEKSNDPSKKIFLQRLKKCRSMFEFIIETRKNAGASLTSATSGTSQ